ncbi:gamma-glutamyltransferase [Aliifodinibius sp. S!AR15-10]|uniref:gamma-glutamyltransferase n=1 Tax=Aliifodinibius sp. S!AR15-10 TaxID=2950437 RepID=UPI00285D4C6B|nr:gamma-glutamyltransferase [Aliifodinibius sp. S!AR15-10]MDR8390650.1 gamma-glutamyltransferase [Aliifodinibius sp. S!AR15-10]
MKSSAMRSSLFFVLLIMLSSIASAQPDRLTGKPFATRSEVIGEHGMVATSQPLAVQVGLDILKKGGNAIDAAIATNAALGVMEPTGNGIGGDLFAIIWSAEDQRLYGLNASGRSPLGLSYEQMKQELEKRDRESIPPYGFLPISVPGTVDGWFQMHDKLGSMPMNRILQPAIEYAEEGFPVSELIAFYWDIGARIHSDSPGGFKEEMTINGRGPAKGEIMKRPTLATTLSTLAKNGRDAFYEGEIADRIDQFMRENGGFLRKRDFEEHTSTWVEPVSVNYRGYDVYELPPNGQGIAALQMLQILEGYDLQSMGYGSEEALHYMMEAKKLAFEDRAKFYADPAFEDIPVSKLVSEEYATQRREQINENSANTVEPGMSVLEDGDTIYLTTADSVGNMVSLIQSNYRGMGSGIVVPGTGFVFQDRGELFSMDPDHANVYEAGKRPFHTIIPAFVMKDGEPFMSFGVMGGGMQPQGHVQILTNIIDFGMNAQEAGDAARWRHSGSTQPTDAADKVLQDGGTVNLESGYPWDLIRGLMLRGHDVEYSTGGYGGYQAIMYDSENGVYYGASESRKDGHAAGY